MLFPHILTIQRQIVAEDIILNFILAEKLVSIVFILARTINLTLPLTHKES